MAAHRDDSDHDRWTRRCRRASVVVVLASLLTLVGTVGLTDRPAVGADPVRPRLLVIGDSIILGTQGNIAAALGDWDVVFDADVSRSTAAGLDVLARHGTEFDVVVVALGANDGESPGVFAPRVGALLDALRPVEHVAWLTINEVRPYYPQANAIIRDRVAQYPNAVVGDWHATIRPGDVGSDGLHLTGQGAVHMAAWVAALTRLIAAPPPTTTTSSTTTSTSTTTTSTTTTLPIRAATTVAASDAPPPATAGENVTGGTGRSWTSWGVPAIVALIVGLAVCLGVLRSRDS